jgi:hypothetical protein
MSVPPWLSSMPAFLMLCFAALNGAELSPDHKKVIAEYIDAAKSGNLAHYQKGKVDFTSLAISAFGDDFAKLEENARKSIIDELKATVSIANGNEKVMAMMKASTLSSDFIDYGTAEVPIGLIMLDFKQGQHNGTAKIKMKKTTNGPCILDVANGNSYMSEQLAKAKKHPMGILRALQLGNAQLRKQLNQ